MTLQQPGLTALAKQGDLTAIAALMNRSLQPKGIVVRVAYQKGHLRVLLEGQTVPDQTSLAPYIRKGILALQIPGLHTLGIWGRSQGNSTPAWNETFALTAVDAGLNALERDCQQHDRPPHDRSPHDRQPHDRPPAIDRSDSPLETNVSLNQSANQAYATVDGVDAADPDAIASHLNQAMATEALVFEASLSDRSLKLTVKTNQILEGATFAKAVQDQLLPLNLAAIDVVQLYKQKTQGKTSYKIKEFTLSTEPAPTEDAATRDMEPSQPVPTARSMQLTPTSQASSQAAKSKWVVVALVALVVVLLIGAIKLLAKPPAAADVCRGAGGTAGYCQLAVQMMGEQTLHNLKAAAAPITPAMEAEGLSLCANATDLQLQRKPARQTTRYSRSNSAETLFPGVMLVDTQLKAAPQSAAPQSKTAPQSATPQTDVTLFRTACLLAGNDDRVELIKNVVLPNSWPQEPYQGKQEWEPMQRSLKAYQILMMLGGGTLFTAIGLFAASALNLGFQLYSFKGLFQTASILGTLDTLLIIISGAKLNLFGGLPLTCLALGLTQLWVKDLRVDWAAGYRTVALGVFVMMIIRTILNWLLLGFIFSVL